MKKKNEKKGISLEEVVSMAIYQGILGEFNTE
jgi:hypothetical protein